MSKMRFLPFELVTQFCKKVTLFIDTRMKQTEIIYYLFIYYLQFGHFFPEISGSTELHGNEINHFTTN